MIYQNTLYLIDDNGSARAVNKLNGHEIWKHKVGTLAAASPTFDARHHLVFVPRALGSRVTAPATDASSRCR